MLGWLSGYDSPLVVFALVALPFATLRLGRIIQRPALWPLVAFGPLLFAAYISAGLAGGKLFPWYAVPAVPFLLIAIIVAVDRGIGKLRSPARLLPLILAVFLLPGFPPTADNLTREKAFVEAASLVSSEVTAETLVALPEIGAFGYYSKARVLDTVGLVSPEVISYYPLPVEPSTCGLQIAVPPDLIKQRRPDYLVALDGFLSASLTAADWFAGQYRLAGAVDAPIWGCSHVLVYERVDFVVR